MAIIKLFFIISLAVILNAATPEPVRGESQVTSGITVTIIIPDRKRNGQIPVDSDSVSLGIKTPARDTSAIRSAVRLDTVGYKTRLPQKTAPAVQ